MIVFAFETSCDDTAAAIVQYEGLKFTLLSTVHASQEGTHRPYGGVVPELATRDHVRWLPLVAQHALREANVPSSSIDLIAATKGPGLTVALLVGHTFGKCIAASLGKPFVGVNHLHGHLLSPFLHALDLGYLHRPHVCLLVSGGHTLLLHVQPDGRYRVLGTTRDDAAGEAFDKTARLLGLPYPGGPAISKAAAHGDPNSFRFPRPMINEPGLDFSFSGLKTAVKLQIEELRLQGQLLENASIVADLAASVQSAIVDTLVEKVRRALLLTNCSLLTLAGGVAANACLRTALERLCMDLRVDFVPVHSDFSADNAVMIAAAAAWLYSHGTHSTLDEEVQPQADLKEGWLRL